MGEDRENKSRREGGRPMHARRKAVDERNWGGAGAAGGVFTPFHSGLELDPLECVFHLTLRRKAWKREWQGVSGSVCGLRRPPLRPAPRAPRTPWRWRLATIDTIAWYAGENVPPEMPLVEARTGRGWWKLGTTETSERSSLEAARSEISKSLLCACLSRPEACSCLAVRDSPRTKSWHPCRHVLQPHERSWRRLFGSSTFL